MLGVMVSEKIEFHHIIQIMLLQCSGRRKMQEISQTENTASYVMTSESVAAYIQHEIDRGASKDSIRNFKRVTNSLFEWLPEDKTITKTGCRNGGRL